MSESDANESGRPVAPGPPAELLAAGASPDPADPLGQIVDDYAPRQDAIEFAVAQLEAERPFESVLADLTDAGWPPVDAEAILESARQQTRFLRGALTRDDALR